MTQGFEHIYNPVQHVIDNPTTAPTPTHIPSAVGFTRTLARAMTPENADVIHTYLERLGPEYVLFGWQFAAERDPVLYTTETFFRMSQTYVNAERNDHG